MENSKMDGIKIQPVILCGGSGTRLWPLSTIKIPKQFISIGTKGTLLEETIERVAIVMDKCRKLNFSVCEPLLIMHKSHNLPIILERHKNNIIYEEYANDTSVAIMRAIMEIENRYPNEKIILLSLHSDHYIEQTDSFVNDIVEGITHVTNDNIVLYGIEPLAPETKYGYIIPDFNRITFKEKPDKETAMMLITRGAYWNSGIFASTTETIHNCLKISPYNINDWINNPREGKAASFDVAVLQQYGKIYAQLGKNWGWSDVGTWDSFISISETKKELSDSLNSITSNCNNVKVINRGNGYIVALGCENLLIVMNGDNVLVISTTKDYNNNLKEIATNLGK